MLVLSKKNWLICNSIRNFMSTQQAINSKINFSRKLKKIELKIKFISKIKTKSFFTEINDDKLKIEVNTVCQDLEEMSKILSKKIISIKDEDIFFAKLEEINKSPMNNLRNKLFERIFYENISKLRINSNKYIIHLIFFIEKYNFSSANLDFKVIDKKIFLHINFFDPDTIIKTLILYSKFMPDNYSERMKSFQISIERILNQFSLINLTKIFYLFSNLKEKEYPLLNKINKQILFKLNEKQRLSSDDISRLTISILSNYTDYDLIHPIIWAEINDNILKDRTNDSKKLSISLYLLAKSNFFDRKLFERVEKRVFSLMMDLKMDISIIDENKIDKFEDITRILNSFSISSKGSYALWLQFFILSEFYIDHITFTYIDQFLEILLHKSYIYSILRENTFCLNQVREIIQKIASRIEEIYTNQNLFSNSCSKMNLKEICECIIKSEIFSEKFTDLCLLILTKLKQNSGNRINNNL